MRREYDFSKGTRGKHAGKRLRVVGDTRTEKGQSAAARIQQIIERDLKSREDFRLYGESWTRRKKKTFALPGLKRSALFWWAT